MVFRKKQKPPLTDAIRMVDNAIEIAYKYKRARTYIPTEKEFKLFEDLLEAFWQNHCTLQYIIRCLGQRSRGEPEGAAKFTSPKALDYHYPK